MNDSTSIDAVARHRRPPGPRYKWVALSNTTLGVLISAMNSSILLISLPAIFRGLHINPLVPAETGYLLWTLLGYMVVTATLLVTLGRLSDMWGRVRLYNLGFVIFTIASILLFLTPSTGNAGATEIIVFRLIQGVGGGFLMANSAAILTDAFPPRERGFALGVNMVAALAGALAGLLLGGVLATIQWRVVFLVSVPFGVIGTVWAYLMLREQGERHVGRGIDVLGNACLGLGLISLLVAMTYGIMPYGTSNVGWGDPLVIAGVVVGLALIGAFVVVEQRVREPLFHLDLFRIRGFSAGNLAQFFSALAFGGLQFMIIIWLQGVWLPLHGYAFEVTPLWAAVYMIPLLVGFMLFGVIGGWLSDRFSVRALTTGGMLVLAAGFLLLTRLPANFHYLPFAVLLFVVGSAFGVFSAPNAAAIMNALPPRFRGVGSGMRSTFQTTGQPLSLTVFFTIVVLVLASRLPPAMEQGLASAGVPAQPAAAASHVPPTGALFAAFLGYNPMATLLPPEVIHALPSAQQATVLGTQFFPGLISKPLMQSLRAVFYFSALLALLAATASVLRGGRYVADEDDLVAERAPVPAGAPQPSDGG